MIKLLTIDLDGTLFDKDKQISTENKIAIKKAREKGVKVVVATGRPTNGIIKVLEELDIKSSSDYVICYNGARIINAHNRKPIINHLIKGSDVKKLDEERRRLNLFIHAFRGNEELIRPIKNPYTDVEAKINQIPDNYFDFNEINDNEDFIKMMLIDDEEKLNDAEIKLDPYFKEHYNVVRSARIFLEFLNKDADKGKAMLELANILGLDNSEVMAIGDAGNDLGMIINAGIGVAMANSFKPVLDAADYITLSNEESGVAHAINKFILNDK